MDLLTLEYKSMNPSNVRGFEALFALSNLSREDFLSFLAFLLITFNLAISKTFKIKFAIIILPVYLDYHYSLYKALLVQSQLLKEKNTKF